LNLAGALAGGTVGVMETYAANHDAGWGEYLSNGLAGAAFGAANPYGGLAGLAGASIGGATNVMAGGEFFGSGMQLGSLAGGLAGAPAAAIDDAWRAGGRAAASAAAKESARSVAPEALGGSLGALVGLA
jgi:hypothetical protein